MNDTSHNRELLRDYSTALSILVRILDVAAVVAAGFLAYGWRYSFEITQLPPDYANVMLIAVFLCLTIFPKFGLYRSWRGRSLFKQIRILTLAWGTVLFSVIVIEYLLNLHSDYSRQWMTAWFSAGYGGMLFLRVMVYYLLREMRSRGLNHKTVVVVGAGELGQEIVRRIRISGWTGFEVISFFDDDESLQGTMRENVPIRNPHAMTDFVQQNKVDEIWLALPLRAETRMKEILHALRHSTADIRLIPDIFGLRLLNYAMTNIAGMPMVDLRASPMVGWNRFIKGAEDKILAFVILLLISPLAVVIAIAIKKTSPGPVFFKQKRHGWDGRVINVYKFRTMHVHQESTGTVTQATKNDPRVTTIGGFLRRTSLDELPQFYNVLQGRMSIVGPRPHAVEHNEQYKDLVDQYMLRHKVKPGITGWAQINGCRGETDTLEKMQKRIQYDLYYIENWSLWFDLKIIFLTIIKGFIGRNAY